MVGQKLTLVGSSPDAAAVGERQAAEVYTACWNAVRVSSTCSSFAGRIAS
jgi:ABC-type uncharacterized transport system permease subunit